MRSKDQGSEHIILHQLRARKATLWNKEYSVTAALVGVASNPKELAETALLELPTRNQPNQYHIYHGTQYSRTIEGGTDSLLVGGTCPRTSRDHYNPSKRTAATAWQATNQEPKARQTVERS